MIRRSIKQPFDASPEFVFRIVLFGYFFWAFTILRLAILVAAFPTLYDLIKDLESSLYPTLKFLLLYKEGIPFFLAI